MLESVRVFACGAAPISPSVIREFVNGKCQLNLDYKEGYGMTEASIISRSLNGFYVKGSVGKLVSNMEARVVGVEGEGQDVETGEIGEIYVRGERSEK